MPDEKGEVSILLVKGNFMYISITFFGHCEYIKLIK